MKRLISSSVILATASLGVSVFNVNQAQAITLSTTATADTYLDSRFPNTHFGQNAGMTLGQVPNLASEQSMLLRFDDLLRTPEGQFATNVQASLSIQGLHNGVDILEAEGFALRRGNWDDATTSITFNNVNDWIDTETSLFTGGVTRRNDGRTTFMGEGLNNLVQAWLNGNTHYGLAIKASETANPGTERNFDRFATLENSQFPAATLNVTYDLVETMPWQLELRAGSPGDWELALQEPGNNTPVGTTIKDLVWRNGQTKDWELEWNRSTNALTFTIDGKSTQHIFTEEPNIDFFQGLRIFAKSETKETATSCDRVAPGTLIDFQTTQFRQFRSTRFNNLPDNPWRTTATSPDPNEFNFVRDLRINDRNFTLNNLLLPLEGLRGTATMSWNNPGCPSPQRANARSLTEVIVQGLGFRVLTANANPELPAELLPEQTPLTPSQTVPEPVSVIGLLGLGLFGITRIGKDTLHNDCDD